MIILNVEVLSVEETAKLLHKAPQYIRWGLQQQRLPFGSAVQKPNGKWSYNIIKNKVLDYIGKEDLIKEVITDEKAI